MNLEPDMNDMYKAFITAVARDLAMSPNEVAFECIAATMNLPSMGKYSGGNPPPCRFDIPTPAAVDTAAVDTSALDAEIASLKAEIASLRAARDIPNTTPIPKVAKVSTSNGNFLSEEGSLREFAVNGVGTPAKSWRAATLHMLELLTEAGLKGRAPAGWFRDEPTDRTVTLRSGDHAFASLTAKLCENRIRDAAVILNVNVTFRILHEDGTIHDHTI